MISNECSNVFCMRSGWQEEWIAAMCRFTTRTQSNDDSGERAGKEQSEEKHEENVQEDRNASGYKPGVVNLKWLIA